MKITNKFGVPETLMSLANRNFYSKGKADYSVTEIISSPRIKRLQAAHWERMEQDVSEMLWSLMGSALHVVAERGQTENHVTEERLTVEIENVTLSGAIDLQHIVDGVCEITDYKFTSVWSLMNDKPDWVTQQNIYAWMVHKVKGLDVRAVRICALLRDWNRRDTIKEGYPQAPIQVVELPLWDFDKTEQYVRERIGLHQQAKFLADMEEELPLCTDEDRWVRGDKFAVKREGRKTAIRVFETKEEADELAKKENGYVEFRKGEPIRCTGNFCSVAQWCSQYQQEVSGGDEGGGVRPEGGA